MEADGRAGVHGPGGGRGVSAGADTPVLLLTPDPGHSQEIERLLRLLAVPVQVCARGEEALRLLLDRAAAYRCLLCAPLLPDMSAIALIEPLRAAGLDLPVILVSANPEMQSTVAAMRAGAHAIIDASQLRSGLLRHVPGLQPRRQPELR